MTSSPGQVISAFGSMSRRRLASNIPTLQCRVEIPPAPSFFSPPTSPFGSPSPECATTEAALPAELLSTASPMLLVHRLPTKEIARYLHTPIDQIMHTPEEPPAFPPLKIDRFRPRRTIRPRNRCQAAPEPSPYVPFTPLEPPSQASKNLESASLTSRLSGLGPASADNDNLLAWSASASSISHQNLPLDTLVLGRDPLVPKCSSQPRFALPRRLSYKIAKPGTPSLLRKHHLSDLSRDQTKTQLASPLLIQNLSLSLDYKPPTWISRTPGNTGRGYNRHRGSLVSSGPSSYFNF